MLHVGDELANYFAEILEAPHGLTAKVVSNTPEGRDDAAMARGFNVIRGQIPFALLGKHTTFNFPLCVVYCRKVANSLRNKFGSISGSAEIVVEGTVTNASVDGLSELISAYVLSVTETLSETRGEWGVGGYYGGAWDVEVEPVKAGGVKYIQTARVTVSVEIRRS